MGQKELIGIIHFQYPIPCRGDVLGKNYKTNINNVEATIAFPRIDYKKETTGIDEFGEKRPIVVIPNSLQSTREDDWGEVVCWNTKGENDLNKNGVLVNQVVIEFATECNEEEKKLNALAEGINKWRTQLYEKSFFLGKTKVKAENNNAFNQKGKGNNLEIYYKETYLPAQFEQRECFDLEFTNLQDCMSPDEIRTILSEIDVSKDLREEYRMLLNAFYEQRAGNTRYAVMEATTAVEMCVTNIIIERCNDLGIDGKGLCDSFYRSLGNRFDLLKHLGIELPTQNPSKELVKPRNDLYHNKNLKPTRKESQDVLEVVHKYLQHYIPDMYESKDKEE